jgi:hypothetical protein
VCVRGGSEQRRGTSLLRGSLVGHRQLDPELAPSADSTFESDLAIHRFHQPATDRQPDVCPFFLCEFDAKTVERLEYFVVALDGNGVPDNGVVTLDRPRTCLYCRFIARYGQY